MGAGVELAAACLGNQGDRFGAIGNGLQGVTEGAAKTKAAERLLIAEGRAAMAASMSTEPICRVHGSNCLHLILRENSWQVAGELRPAKCLTCGDRGIGCSNADPHPGPLSHPMGEGGAPAAARWSTPRGLLCN